MSNTNWAQFVQSPSIMAQLKPAKKSIAELGFKESCTVAKFYGWDFNCSLRWIVKNIEKVKRELGGNRGRRRLERDLK
jgi:hypothetical protein